jgi:hypothetical protein
MCTVATAVKGMCKYAYCTRVSGYNSHPKILFRYFTRPKFLNLLFFLKVLAAIQVYYDLDTESRDISGEELIFLLV